MKFRLIMLLTFIALQTFAQDTFNANKLSDAGMEILLEINKHRSVPFDTMGIRGEYLPKDFPLTHLRERLSVDELLELTKHENPIVRCYGFKALTQRDENTAFQVIVNHLQDTSKIETHYGCFGGTEFASDYFVSVYRGHEAISRDSLHLDALDSLLIFTPNNLEARDGALRRAGPKGKYHDKIREIAVNEKLAGAIIALADFRRPEDVDIIMHTRVTKKSSMSHPLATTFVAICHFPHPAFLPFLESHIGTFMNKPPYVESTFLYMAISNYKSKEAGDLLSRVFDIPDKKLRRDQLEIMSRALKRNSSPVYNELRNRIESELKNL